LFLDSKICLEIEDDNHQILVQLIQAWSYIRPK
jgi:hypothetical protein